MKLFTQLLLLVFSLAALPVLAQRQREKNIQGPTWMADNGNGTFTNPLFYDEFSDPDLIRVGDDYYLTGTTMHAMPGLPVLHSRDLVNWTLLSYAVPQLDLGPSFRLEGGQQVYGQGIWAPCLRYHNGKFYIFSNVNKFTTQLFTATNPRGPWTQTSMARSFHDLSVLFDDDGKTYVVWSYDEVHLAELNDELTDIRPGTEQVIVPKGSGAGEGSHFYKIDGKYFITNTNYDPVCYQVCLRAAAPRGPYELAVISAEENMGTGTGWRLANERQAPPFRLVPPVNKVQATTLHQGGLVQTQTGEWWAWSMMDHNSVGRLTCLSPVTWQAGWPYLGLPGNLTRSPLTWPKPTTGHSEMPHAPFQRSDDFAGPTLQPLWQWNHVPNSTKWSLTERKGYLRLHALPAPDLWKARNTLTQRAIGPESVVTTEADFSKLKPGDVAGLALLNWPYAWLGVARTAAGQLEIRQLNQATNQVETRALPGPRLWLRVACNFDTEKARFSYSTDGQTFAELGAEVVMVFQLRTFQGVRYGLFNFNTEGKEGGYADFNDFVVREPRPRGLSQPIPYGRVINLRSRADSAVLVSRRGTVQAVPATNPLARTAAAQFRVADRGLGRVALQSVADGRWVTVHEPGGLADVRLEPTEQGTASQFQWEDLQHGDLMLLSLRTSRYLVAAPDSQNPCAANAPGTQPDHRDGVCFGWTVVADSSTQKP